MNAQAAKASAVVLIAALGFAGCGSGGDTTSALTKAQFIKQADAICENADEVQIAALGKAEKEIPGDYKNQAKQEKMIVGSGLPPIQKEAEEISELEAPSGDEEKVTAIVKGIEEAVAATEEDPINSVTSSFVEVDKLAADYGFKACAEVS